RSKDLDVVDLTPGTKTLAAQFTLPLGDSVPYEVDVDPYKRANGGDPTKSKIPLKIPDVYGDGSQGISTRPLNPGLQVVGKSELSGSFKPAPPSKAIDYFDPAYYV